MLRTHHASIPFSLGAVHPSCITALFFGAIASAASLLHLPITHVPMRGGACVLVRVCVRVC